MIQRWCRRLRSLATLKSHPHLLQHGGGGYLLCRNRLLHSYPNLLHKPSIGTQSVISSHFTPQLNAYLFPYHLSRSPTSLIQVRHITAKQRKRKLKRRKPMTPVTSKVKKIKIKGCFLRSPNVTSDNPVLPHWLMQK